MKTASIFAFALLVASASAQLEGQTYAELQPGQYAIDLSFRLNGMDSSPAACTNSASNSTCLPLLKAGTGDSVKIMYSVNGTAPVNSTATITLKACFSAATAANRAWRKPSPIIVDDKQCSVKIAAGLPYTGEYTYVVGPDSIPAVFNILALEICEGGAACGTGRSLGYYQVEAINYTPTWLLAMTGVFATIGPIVLASFFVWEFKMKKKV